MEIQTIIDHNNTKQKIKMKSNKHNQNRLNTKNFQDFQHQEYHIE